MYFIFSVEIIELEEDLDYELDVDMDEDELLVSEEEKCGEFWSMNWVNIVKLSMDCRQTRMSFAFFEKNVGHLQLVALDK